MAASIRNPDMDVFDWIPDYCTAYNIPQENLREILEDQKVLPMIRGKATEFAGANYLKEVLDAVDWNVEKLNLNPQPSTFDQDISVTYRRTGARLTAETKNAVRESFKMGRGRIPNPYFKVKCHKSRSNLTRQLTTNDKYIVGEFDLLLCNPSNGIFKGKTLERGMHLLDDDRSVDWLKEFYEVNTGDELIKAAYDDWRFCLPVSIADEDGAIPRNPKVMMEDDPNWFRVDQLAANLRSLIDGTRS